MKNAAAGVVFSCLVPLAAFAGENAVTFDDVPLGTPVIGTSDYWPDLEITPIWSGGPPETCALGVPCVVGERGEVITTSGESEVVLPNPDAELALYRAASPGACVDASANAPDGNGCLANGGLAFPGFGARPDFVPGETNPCGWEPSGRAFVSPPARGFGVKLLPGPNPLPLRYEFRATEGRTLGELSIDGRDFGDFESEHSGTFRVELVGYDELDEELARSYLAWEVVNGDVVGIDQDGTPWVPRSPVFPSAEGTVFEFGDACTAESGEPGNFTLSLSQPGMARVALVYSTLTTDATGNAAWVPVGVASPGDPFVAYDNLSYTVEEACHWPRSAWTAGRAYTCSLPWVSYTKYWAGRRVALYAGRSPLTGYATFSKVEGGEVTITVQLLETFRFSEVGWHGRPLPSNLHIQGYDTAPGQHPAPLRFDNRSLQPGGWGRTAVVTVPAARFYGINAVVNGRWIQLWCNASTREGPGAASSRQGPRAAPAGP